MGRGSWLVWEGRGEEGSRGEASAAVPARGSQALLNADTDVSNLLPSQPLNATLACSVCTQET